jgi:Zn finger protein HypA/HybF involved in hydrogenase expression
MSELTPEQRDAMMRRLTAIAVELDVIDRAANVAGTAVPLKYEQLHRERHELETKLWNRIEVTRSEQEDDRNHLACPKCKSTDLDFKGLRNNMRADGAEGGAEPDVEVVSATYSWECKKCKHDFKITIRN